MEINLTCRPAARIFVLALAVFFAAQLSAQAPSASPGACLYSNVLKINVHPAPPVPQVVVEQAGERFWEMAGIRIANLPEGFWSKLDDGEPLTERANYAGLLPGLHTLTVGRFDCEETLEFRIGGDALAMVMPLTGGW